VQPIAISRRSIAVAIMAAIYVVYFEFEGLAHYCLSPTYGYPELALAIPPFALHRVTGVLALGGAIFGCWFYVSALFSLLATSRGLAVVLLPFVFLITGIADYYVTRTGVPISSHVMEAVFETNTIEISEAVSWRLMMSLTFSVLLCGVLLWVLWPDLDQATSPGPKVRRALRTIGAGIVAAYALLAPIEGPLAFYPYSLLRASAEYLDDKIEMDRRLARRRDISADGVEWAAPASDDLVVVVVLGESARADHFSLNGYGRPTNPRLEKVANLVSFPDVSACATLTRTAVPCLMTRATASGSGCWCCVPSVENR
jgi:lipid A ethanolaminephosphotransferase